MIKQKIVNILGESYTVEFPTIGQLQDIEAFKISYTNGKYVDMALSNFKIHNFMLDVTDAVSYLSILIPELKSNMKIKTWRDLDPIMAKALVQDYKNEFIPWFKPLVDDLYNFDKEDLEDGKQSQE